MDGVSQGLRLCAFIPSQGLWAFIPSRAHMLSLMVKEVELIEKLHDMNLGIQLNLDYIWCSMLKVTNAF